MRTSRLLRRLSLGTKIVLCFLLVLIMPLGALGGYYALAMRASLYEQSMAIFEANLGQLAEVISRRAGNARRLVELFTQERNIRSVFGSHYESESARTVDYQVRSMGLAKSMISLNPEINSIFLYNDHLALCEMATSFVSLHLDNSPEQFAKLSLQDIGAGEGWTLNRTGLNNYLQAHLSPESALSFSKPILDYTGKRAAARMELVVDEAVMFAELGRGDSGESIYAVDQDGTVVSGAGGGRGAAIESLGFHGFRPGEAVNRIAGDSILISVPVAELGVSLVAIVPLAGLGRGYLQIVPSLVMGIGLALAICLLLFYLIIHALLRGVKPMLLAMREVRNGNFATRLPISGGDELSVLAENFNFMSEQLEAQVKRVYLLGQMEREAEFRVLEANMNPHFLYNSLATISWMARSGGVETIERAAHALGQYYRMILAKGKSVIRLGEEIEMLDAYLVMQKLRFEERFQVYKDIDGEALDFPIIKNILQPLVENAIDHGILPKLGGGAIWIEAKTDGDRLTLQVRDDGVGMEEQRRREVLSGGAPAQEKGGYAIGNILRRLGMFYGRECAFSLQSEPGKGTCVRVELSRAREMTAKGEV